MPLSTPFTELVGCSLPLQQAGMTGTATPALAAAVTGAGALGMLGAAGAAASLERDIAAVTALTSGGFGITFLMPFLDREAVALAAERVRLVEFFYAEPDAGLIELVHQGGALAGWQVGSLGEAVMAAEAGCDLVVVQGAEAGGHVRSSVGLLSLLEDVLEKVEVPVVAAGGIGSARGVAAVLGAGAAGVRVGTRFVAAEEADAHPAYVDALIAAQASDTTLTTAFSVFWPDAPHRVLRSCIEAAEAAGDNFRAEVVLADGRRMPMPRFAAPSPGRQTEGDVAAMALYAGESVGQVHSRMGAAQIVAELMEGANALLQRW